MWSAPVRKAKKKRRISNGKKYMPNSIINVPIFKAWDTRSYGHITDFGENAPIIGKLDG